MQKKRDFSLRGPTHSQERMRKKKSARSVRNYGGWYEAVRGAEEVAAGALSMAQLARLGKLIPSDSCVAEFGPPWVFP